MNSTREQMIIDIGRSGWRLDNPEEMSDTELKDLRDMFAKRREPVTKDSPLARRYDKRLVTPGEAILELVRSFPTLRPLVEGWNGTDWDMNRLLRGAGGLGTGARHALHFVAGVWNPGDAKAEGIVFDAVDAMGSWDRAHRNAFITWCADPWWA